MTIHLTRATRQNKAVCGKIEFGFCDWSFGYDTMENADYLIPDGRYPIKMTWSPRFKKNMPEICDVPEREGIRVHLGSKPEHSEGCVLLHSMMALENLKACINYNEKYNEEDLFIEIKTQG